MTKLPSLGVDTRKVAGIGVAGVAVLHVEDGDEIVAVLMGVLMGCIPFGFKRWVLVCLFRPEILRLMVVAYGKLALIKSNGREVPWQCRDDLPQKFFEPDFPPGILQLREMMVFQAHQISEHGRRCR